jgi:hypothetical protein
MRKPAMIVVPLIVVALLGGCAPVPDQGTNPLNELDKVFDLIPWAKSVAADTSTQQLTARVGEIRAGLPSLDIPAATRTDIEARLNELTESLLADPTSAGAHASELNAILDEIRAAL